MFYSSCIPAVLGKFSIPEALEKTQAAGLKHYEFWGWEPAQIDAYWEAQQACGLTAVAMCTTFHDLTDPACRDKYVAGIQETIPMCQKLGCKNIILTGVSYAPGRTGVVVFENGEYAYYEHELLPNSCHGTGDIYASAFVGAFVQGKSAYDAASIAANYTMDCIRCTASLDNHWYGAAFEPVLGKLMKALQ